MIIESQIVLKAEEGKMLTNGDTFGTVVYLSGNDGADNWHEITVEEYESILAEEQKFLEE